MNKKYKILIMSTIVFLACYNAILFAQADTLTILYDEQNDVLVSTNINDEDRDFAPAYNPDCDIGRLSVYLDTYSEKIIVTLTMNPAGNIINQHDLDSFSNPTTTGRSTFYSIYLKTNVFSYSIMYMNYTCILNYGYDDISYEIYGSEIIFTFNMTYPFETYELAAAACYDCHNTSIDGYNVYADYVPNQATIGVYITSVNEGFINEKFSFSAGVQDFFNQSKPPYTFHWDYGDGYSETFINNEFTNHTYTEPGVYMVRLTFNDSENNYAYYEKLIDINKPLPKRFDVIWKKYEANVNLFSNLYISKNEKYETDYIFSSPLNSILTEIKSTVEWTDDYTHGLDSSKGQDTLNIEIKVEDDKTTKDSTGSGKLIFNHQINDKPEDFIVSADTLSEAEQKVASLISGKNEITYDFKFQVLTGEKIWNLLRYLRDKGNDLDMYATYWYYSYTLEYIDE